MTLIVDDLLIQPFMFVLESIQTLAIHELYDVEEIENELKENQLLYEIGERSEEVYQERRAMLEEELALAREAHAQLQQKSIEVRG